jgi:soluble lytic murein transglycosylase-like protein
MTYELMIIAAAKLVKVSPQLLLAICVTESNLKNVVVPHDGGSPTYGICQVKLDTAKMLGYTGNAKGLMDPKTNIKFAALYLKYQKDRYQYDWCKATAAYNAGRYNESKKMPGYPMNLKYVRLVQSKLEPKHRYKLTCR